MQNLSQITMLGPLNARSAVMMCGSLGRYVDGSVYAIGGENDSLEPVSNHALT